MDTLNDIISGLKWGNLDPVEAHDRILALFDVSQQRELLISYEKTVGCMDINEVEKEVDKYLKNKHDNE